MSTAGRSVEYTWDNAVTIPRPLAAFNKVAGLRGGWVARRAFSLDPNDLVAAARTASGLDDLGPPTYWDGLVALTDALESQAQLNALGRMGLRTLLVNTLAARARVFAWRAEHPEATEVPVAPPLMICGLPRTGTTLLSHLFAADPANRTLRHFEASDPAPPPVPGQEATDPRMAKAEKELANLDRIAPGFQSMHPMDPDGATEVVVIHVQEMTSVQVETQAFIPSYAAWIDAQDLHAVYEYERQVLQVLQHGYDVARWNLKTPAYLLGLDVLFDTYPDAGMVWTHRDPAAVVASVASLNTALHRVSSDHVDREAVARHWCERLGVMVDRAMAWLDAHPDAHLTHLDYRDLVGDPVGSVARVYADLGHELDDDARTHVSAWMDTHPQDLHGRHVYDIADFGLTPEQVRERFAAYCDRFDV